MYAIPLGFPRNAVASVFALAVIFTPWVLSAADSASPGKSDPAGKEPALQVEKDWVDQRWSKTQLGPFFSSSITLPNGAIPKAISIQVGNPFGAAVVYDTAQCQLRGGWIGSFFKMPTDRFGLLGQPKPAGSIAFLAPAQSAWGGGTPHYLGLSVHDQRVVLVYQVGETMIQESPSFETQGEFTCFYRTLEIAAHSQPLSLDWIEWEKGVVPSSDLDSQTPSVWADRENRRTWMGFNGSVQFQKAAGSGTKTSIVIPPSPVAHRVELFLAQGPTSQASALTAWAREHHSQDSLASMREPGGRRWQPLTTQGRLGTGTKQPYVIDTLTVPYDNPWGALFFTSGVDFTDNGDAFVCTIHGDVWKVSGINDSLSQLTWSRFATGLFQPLGLRVFKNEVYVLGRDQITVLRDRNGDSEADEYENFCNLIHTSLGGHDYVTSLEVDAAGNFFYVDPSGVHRVSPDGKSMHTIATGWRNPNGMSVGPDGTITVTPQQGNWTPSSQISEVIEGGYYGYGGPKVTPTRPLGYDLPLCWIPHSVDNSTGSQVWVTSEHWGPLKGQLLSLSFGRAAMDLVLREKVDGVAQGAVVPMKGKFLSGAMRGTFRKQDGQLYVVGSQGWQTAGARDGCLQRVRYTGAKFYELVGLHSRQNGMELIFTEPVDRSTAEDLTSYELDRWNYRYAAEYGSKDYSVSDPKKEGHDRVEIASATLLPDGKSVFLKVSSMAPVMQMHLKYNLNAADGGQIRGDVYPTIHRLGEALEVGAKR